MKKKSIQNCHQKVYNLTLLLSLSFATVTTHNKLYTFFFYLTKDERDKNFILLFFHMTIIIFVELNCTIIRPENLTPPNQSNPLLYSILFEITKIFTKIILILFNQLWNVEIKIKKNRLFLSSTEPG